MSLRDPSDGMAQVAAAGDRIDRREADGTPTGLQVAAFLLELGISFDSWNEYIKPKAVEMGRRFAAEMGGNPDQLGAAVLVGLSEGFVLGVEFTRDDA